MNPHIERTLTVNITEKTEAALEECATWGLDSETDIVNRAVQLYTFLSRHELLDGDVILYFAEDGSTRKLTIG